MKRKEKKKLMKQGRSFTSPYGEFKYHYCRDRDKFVDQDGDIIFDYEWEEAILVPRERTYKLMEPYVMAELMQKHGKVLETNRGHNHLCFDASFDSPWRVYGAGEDVSKSSWMTATWKLPCRVLVEPPKPPKPKTETCWQWLIKNMKTGECDTTGYYTNSKGILLGLDQPWVIVSRIEDSKREFKI